MGVWEGLSLTSQNVCDVPKCFQSAVTVFLPAFESSGGWSGDNQEYDPKLNIAFVCNTHKPLRLKTVSVPLVDWQSICQIVDDAQSFYEMFHDWEGVPERMERIDNLDDGIWRLTV